MTTQPKIYDTYAEALTYIESFAPIDVGGEIGLDHLDTTQITDLADFTQELTSTMVAVATIHSPDKRRIQLQLAYYRNSSTAHPEVLGVLYRFITMLPSNGTSPRSYSHFNQVNTYLKDCNWRFNKIPPHTAKAKRDMFHPNKSLLERSTALEALGMFSNIPRVVIPVNTYSR